MGRVKGTPKTGGRKAGTPNRITTDLKEWVTEILENGQDLFTEHLHNLEPREFVRVYVGLLSFVLPKQQSVNVEAQHEIREQNKPLTKEEMKELQKWLEEE